MPERVAEADPVLRVLLRLHLPPRLPGVESISTEKALTEWVSLSDMSISDSRRPFQFHRVCTVGLGVVLTVGGLLGLYNLQGAGGGVWLLVIQAYGVIAVGMGAAFIYGGLVRPRSLRHIVVIVSRVSAVIVLLPSIVAVGGGVTGGGELAPFFIGIGVAGVVLALLLGAISLSVERRTSNSAPDEAM